MKTECARPQLLIQLLLDGRIDLAQRGELDRHMAECANCAAELEEYRTLSMTATAWASPTAADVPTDDFNDRLLRAMERETATVRTANPASLALPIVIGSIFAIAGGVWLARDTDVLSSATSALSPVAWGGDLAQIPALAHQAAVSAWSAIDGLLSGSAGVALPNWTLEAGIAAIAVNAFFIIQTVAQRRRQRI